MDFSLTEAEQAKKEEFEDFFREEMKHAPPIKASMEAWFATDEAWAFHLQTKKKLADKGWLTMAWPKEYGGYEASIMEQLLFNETIAYFRAPGIDGWGLHMFAPTLMLYGTEEQKQRLLPPIANAEKQYCQCWSEPNAGSDLASLRTTAIKDGDHYVVNGQKIWITGAQRADRCFLLARTDPTSKRNAGLSVFTLAMDTPGVEIRPIHYMNRDHIYNEVYFTDVRIHERDRIGDEGKGWESTRATMNFERSGVGTFASAQRTFKNILEFMKTTKRDGRALADDPIVRQKLAKLHIDIEIGKALAYKVAWLQEVGKQIFSAAAASESKVFGTELGQRIANFTTEIVGLHGMLSPSDWAPFNGSMVEAYQMAPGSNIAAGSSEIQRNIIAWVGVGLPRFK